MAYESEIQFTLDTICPWTYLAKRRLQTALSQLTPEETAAVHFTLTIKPYQLYPNLPHEGTSKEAWFRASRYGDTDDKLAMYQHLMSARGEAEGLHFRYGGTIANTLPAHRVIQHVQATHGPETAGKLVDSLYRQYFEEEASPSADETLLKACAEAGLEDGEARTFVVERREEGEEEVKALIAEQKGNQVDAVPVVTVIGKRRDHTLEGAKEVKEYLTVLRRVVRESS